MVSFSLLLPLRLGLRPESGVSSYDLELTALLQSPQDVKKVQLRVAEISAKPFKGCSNKLLFCLKSEVFLREMFVLVY